MKRNVTYLPALVITAVLVLSLFCGAARASDDDRIESAARNSYVFKTYLKDDHIDVRSKEGVVTLEGTVGDESHKSLAQETVANLPGVRSVDNNLQVKGQQPNESSDAWLKTRVELSLLFHRNVSALKTGVEIENGVVTLKGTASNEAQKELTAEYVKDVAGVKDVKNEMTVSGGKTNKKETLGEKIDDASITAQVKLALLFHGATSAINTKVETRDGIVTVSGKADNAAEKDLVTKLVSDIHGVKDVKNEMTVE